VRDLAPPPRNPKPPEGADGCSKPIFLAQQALLEAQIRIKKLRDCRVSEPDRHRLNELIGKLSAEMQLQRHLP
jgi:hypothetical protein